MAQIVTEARRGGGRTAALLAGDVVALLVFAAVGRRSHGEAAGLAAALEVARTAAPFILGWLATAPWLGAYSPRATATPARMLQVTALAWPAALLVGALLRALLIGRLSPPSFYVVTFLAALLLLGGWRLAFSLAEARRPRP